MRTTTPQGGHMGQFTVTPESLHDLSVNLSGSSDQIQHELQAAGGRVNDLLASDWRGATSGQFQELWSQWQQSAASLQQALQGMSTFLEHASGAYAQADQAVSQQLHG